VVLRDDAVSAEHRGQSENIVGNENGASADSLLRTRVWATMMTFKLALLRYDRLAAVAFDRRLNAIVEREEVNGLTVYGGADCRGDAESHRPCRVSNGYTFRELMDALIAHAQCMRRIL